MEIFVKFTLILLFSPLVLCYKDANILKAVQVRSKRSTQGFRVTVKEKGKTFTEVMKVDISRQTAFYSVPAHPGVDRSEVLNVYARNLTVTRLPDKKLCHVRQMAADEPSPRKLTSDMETVNAQDTVHKRGVVTVSTQWAVHHLVQNPNTLGATIANFCRNLPIYMLTKMGEDGVQVVTTSSDSRQKRQTKFQGFTLCKPISSYPDLGCNPANLKMRCILRTGTCIYRYTCSVQDVVRNKKGCTALHSYSGIFCCDPFCS